MAYTTLISALELAPHLGEPDWAIVDCRFSLADNGLGRRVYLEAHIPGAVYAHLDEDLSGEVIKGQTGRHPLPPVPMVAEKLSSWGVDARVQVVAYDDTGGAMAAARLWWLLRWLGHRHVAVLDGGWQSWLAQGLPIRPGEEQRPPRRFSPSPQSDLLAQTEDILGMMPDPQVRILDVRSAERYRGENEPIDPVAGHIPAAISAPYTGNLDEKGKFLPAEALRARYRALIGDTPARDTVFYCGSGVTAAQGVLALAHAGLGEARLYNGSWSEWITDPERPVERGPAPEEC
jgi:thiosulfate/3-mercaptopyruvate sulfurtransferase